jgi:hypothetical protein
MNRMYRVPYNGTIATADGNVDYLSIQPASNKPCRLAGWIIGQTSEVGDAAEEGLRLTVRHQTATVTITGGTSVTPVPNRPGTDLAAGFTAKCNHATVATSSGTDTVVEEVPWNNRNTPWERWIPEDMRPVAVNGEALIVRQETTLADDMTFVGTFFVEELG